MDSSTSSIWTGPFLIEGMSGKLLLSPCVIEIPVINANSVNSYQTSVASDLGLHCLPTSLLWDG